MKMIGLRDTFLPEELCLQQIYFFISK